MVAHNFLRDMRIAKLVQTCLSVVAPYVAYQLYCEAAKVGFEYGNELVSSLVQSVGQCVVTLLSVL